MAQEVTAKRKHKDYEAFLQRQIILKQLNRKADARRETKVATASLPGALQMPLACLIKPLYLFILKGRTKRPGVLSDRGQIWDVYHP